jgi:hypothetical protein
MNPSEKEDALHVRVFRKSEIGSTNNLKDGGTLTIVAELSPLLQADLPLNSAAVEILRNYLKAKHTTTQVASYNEYIWTWCYREQTFWEMCTTNATLEVELDDPADPIVVRIEIARHYTLQAP